jgi:hypothetical protein
MDESKILRNIHLPPNPTAARVRTIVGHDGRGAANGRLTYQVGSDPCRRGARRQEPLRRMPRRQDP